MIDRLLTTPCTIHRATTGTTDAEGNWQPGSTDTVTRCHMQPVISDAEEIVGEQQVTPKWRVWWPVGTVVGADETFTVGGVLYRVQGPPQAWNGPRSPRNDHVEGIAVEANP